MDPECAGAVVFAVSMDHMSDLVTGDEQEPNAMHTVGELLKPSEVARMLGVSRTWLYDAAKDGRVPCVRLGAPDGPVRFIERDLIAWLDRARAGWLPGESGAETLRRAAA
jgi:excisionase family DNA binding protein